MASLGEMDKHGREQTGLKATKRIVEKAVVGMLPKNSYGRELFRHLKVYKGAAHPHEAQTPEALTFTGLTSEPDSRVLDLQDPDAMFCATD